MQSFPLEEAARGSAQSQGLRWDPRVAPRTVHEWSHPHCQGSEGVTGDPSAPLALLAAFWQGIALAGLERVTCSPVLPTEDKNS